MKQPSIGISAHQLRRLAAITATAFALGASATSALAQTYPAWAPDVLLHGRHRRDLPRPQLPRTRQPDRLFVNGLEPDQRLAVDGPRCRLRPGTVARTDAGSHAGAHTHWPADLSCVVYLEAEPGCAPLVFSKTSAYQPRPGTLVMFPGITMHEVPATPGRRVVVAMNLFKQLALDPNPAPAAG